MWHLYNYVGIENSLPTSCELQIRKNGCCIVHVGKRSAGYRFSIGLIVSRQIINIGIKKIL